MVELHFVKVRVVGSNPAGGAKNKPMATDNCVGSCIKYRDRDDLTRWLKTFDTKYNKQELEEIFKRAKPGTYIVWTLAEGLFIY